MPPDDNTAPTQPGVDVPKNVRARELTWALLDDLITDEEMAALDGLLQTDPAARNEYLHCVQLHADLKSEFAAKSSPTAAPSSAKTPVLGFLQSETQPFGLPSPPAEDVKP